MDLRGKKDMIMKVKLDKGAYMPERAYTFDGGLDIRTPEAVIVPARGSVTIDTGVHVAIPYGYVGMLKSKSGLMMRNITSEGVIDCGYTGSIRAKLYTHGDKPVTLQAGAKITQLVIMPILLPSLELVDELEETERGENGFGSTGV